MNTPGTYDLRLVTLSVIVAIFASYAALDLAGRITATRNKARLFWLFGGASAMGLGIWCMHYIGMLAFRMPMKVFYDVSTVVLSLLAAIAASAVALFTVSRRQMGRWQTVTGGVVMGSGIAAMHYIGMAAMRMPARVSYNLPLVLTSIVLAVVISMVALILAFRVRDEKRTSPRKVASAFIMGSAIPVMHYTGMLAASFAASEAPVDISRTMSMSSLGIAVISVSTLLILSLVIVGAFLDRLLSAQKDLTAEAQEALRRNMHALVESEERLRVVTDNARVGLVIVNQDRRYIYANSAYAELLDLPSSAIVGKRVPDVLSRVYEEQIRPRLDRAFAGERVAYELCKPAADEDCHYEVRYEPTTVNGTVSAVVVVVTDLTERKKAELASLRLAAIVEFSDDAIIGKDLNSIITSWNRGAEKIFGYTASEMVGTSITRLIPPDRGEDEDRILGKIRSGESVDHFETLRQTKDGRLINVSVTASPIRDATGTPIGVSKVARDITAQKLSEHALQESEERLRLFVEHAPAALAMFDREMRYLRTSRRWLTDYGLVDRDLRGVSHYEIFPEIPERWREIHRRGLEGEVVAEESDRFERADGTVQWIRWEVRPWYEVGGKVGGLVIFAEDITERKRADATIRMERDRAQRYLDTAEVILLALDLEGRIKLINRKGCSTLGWEENDLLGSDWIDTCVPVRMREPLRRRIDNLLDGNLPYFEIPVLTKSGEERMIGWHNTLLRDAAGCVTGSLSSGEDITERKQLEKQLRMAQKMEVVGQLAGGIAHDFNNLIAVVIGYSEMVQEKLPEADPLRPKVEEIEKAGRRAAALTRQLLAFSRQQVLEPTILSLNAIVTDVQKMLQRLIGEHIELVTSLDPDLASVKADQGQIEQVIMNLAVNARDAMPEGGKLTIETASVEFDGRDAPFENEVASGSFIMLRVTDTGIGMDAETQAHIFEPFFTTKEPGKGTGLGLATVYGVVRQSGGYVRVCSEPGHGTTFNIYLPRVHEEAKQERHCTGSDSFVSGRETILLVEDEESLSRLTRELLEESGYSVLEANNGSEALEIARQYEETIHLLLTDVVMPKMGGPALAKQLTILRPETRVLYMSGYTGSSVFAQELAESGPGLLQKPFTREKLTRNVREVLDSSAEFVAERGNSLRSEEKSCRES